MSSAAITSRYCECQTPEECDHSSGCKRHYTDSQPKSAAQGHDRCPECWGENGEHLFNCSKFYDPRPGDAAAITSRYCECRTPDECDRSSGCKRHYTDTQPNTSSAATTVAALYVYSDGIYAGLPDVDVWGEERDALLYDGPWSVVAHPPCKAWSLMANCRPEIQKGEDGGCFKAALRAVRKWGGVLEHPAHSLAWKRFGLPKPAGAGWTRALFGDTGWTCEVDQRWYGHEANKPTWLYYSGDFAPWALQSGRAPAGDKTVGRSWGQGRDKQRSGTPERFRDVLLDLARWAAVREDQLPDPEASWALR